MTNNNWIQTYTGKCFTPLDPKPEDICAEDIAHHLSNLCRFSGAVNDFYSVAEHSVRCFWYAREVLSPGPPSPLHLAVLLHDAAEAYIIDLPRPIKMHEDLRLYREAEERIHEAVRQAFNIPLCTWRSQVISLADNTILATEKRDLMGPSPKPWIALPAPQKEVIIPWAPKKAEGYFMYNFNRTMEAIQGG